MIRARHVPLDELFLENVNKNMMNSAKTLLFLEASASAVGEMRIIHKIITIFKSFLFAHCPFDASALNNQDASR